MRIRESIVRHVRETDTWHQAAQGVQAVDRLRFRALFEKGIEISKGWKMLEKLSFSSIEWCIVEW